MPADPTPAASADSGTGARPLWAVAVAALTAVGLALRLLGVDESLFADEVYSYRIVANYGLLDVIGQVHDTAITPPLHYLLARVAVEFGDPTTWIRVPSVVLGAATVPITYLLGVRTVGRSAGLFAAAVAAISPFAVFYGTEARAYATLMFLCVLSTLALLTALDSGRRRWLVLYAVSAVLVLYAHYSGVFVVAAQALWALATHRDRFKELLLANLAIALAFLPWIPSFLFQGDEHPPEQISLLSPVTLDSFVDAVLATFPGRPFVDLATVPGRAALVAIGAATALALAAIAWRARAEQVRIELPRASSRVVLLALLAVATPLGITVYSLVDTSLFAPRNLAASLPAAWLLLGALLTAARGVRGALIAGLVVAALTVGAVRSLDDDYRRPAYKEVAASIDEHAAPCEPVVEAIWLAPKNALSKALAPQLRKGHPVQRIRWYERDDWRAVGRSRRVLVVVPQVPSLLGQSWGTRLGPGFTLRSRRIYRGAIPVALYEYARSGGPDGQPRLVAEGGRETIVLPGGRRLPVEQRDAPGFLEGVRAKDEVLTVSGWSVDSRGRRPPRRMMVFDDDGCLVRSGRPSEFRDDVARDRGQRYRRSGFILRTLPGDAETLAQPGRLRVYGTSGSAAWALPSLAAAYPDAR